MRRFGWYQYACCLWAVNLVLAVLAYFIQGMIYVTPFLFIAMFVCWFAFIKLSRTELIGFSDVLENSAPWCMVIAVVSMIYTFVNFFICLYLMRDGGPHIDNGVYCLWEHGFVREITKEEYDALSLVQGRMFTGHLLPFSAVSMVFFSARKKIYAL